MIYDKDKLTKIQELVRKTLTSWEVRDTITYWIHAEWLSADGSTFCEVNVGLLSENTFEVRFRISNLAGLDIFAFNCGIDREIIGEEELTQCLKKLNNLNADDIEDNFINSMNDYFHQIL